MTKNERRGTSTLTAGWKPQTGCGTRPGLTCTYWFSCIMTSLERTLLMVTRLVSVPVYPGKATEGSRESALGQRNGLTLKAPGRCLPKGF